MGRIIRSSGNANWETNDIKLDPQQQIIRAVLARLPPDMREAAADIADEMSRVRRGAQGYYSSDQHIRTLYWVVSRLEAPSKNLRVGGASWGLFFLFAQMLLISIPLAIFFSR